VADQALQACVQTATGNSGLAKLMYLGVRAGGTPHANTSYRWGYGWPYGRGYRALTSAERDEAARLEADYLQQPRAMQCPSKAEPVQPAAQMPGPLP